MPLCPEGLLPRAVPVVGAVQGAAVSLLGQRDSGAGRREGRHPDAKDGFVQVGPQGWTQRSAFRFWAAEREHVVFLELSILQFNGSHWCLCPFPQQAAPQ